MTLKTVLIPLAVLLAGSATAEDVDKALEGGKADALENAVPLKLEVVFSRYQGETKVARLPFTLLLNSDNSHARLKMGLMVPLTVSRKDIPATVQFKDVVTGVSCKARPLSGERFALECGFDQDYLYSPNGGEAEPDKAEAAPAIRRFYSGTTLVLKNGQTAQHSATDPLTGEVLEVDVTLTVVNQ